MIVPEGRIEDPKPNQLEMVNLFEYSYHHLAKHSKTGARLEKIYKPWRGEYVTKWCLLNKKNAFDLLQEEVNLFAKKKMVCYHWYSPVAHETIKSIVEELSIFSKGEGISDLEYMVFYTKMMTFFFLPAKIARRLDEIGGARILPSYRVLSRYSDLKFKEKLFTVITDLKWSVENEHVDDILVVYRSRCNHKSLSFNDVDLLAGKVFDLEHGKTKLPVYFRMTISDQVNPYFVNELVKEYGLSAMHAKIKNPLLKFLYKLSTRTGIIYNKVFRKITYSKLSNYVFEQYLIEKGKYLIQDKLSKTNIVTDLGFPNPILFCGIDKSDDLVVGYVLKQPSAIIEKYGHVNDLKGFTDLNLYFTKVHIAELGSCREVYKMTDVEDITDELEIIDRSKHTND